MNNLLPITLLTLSSFGIAQAKPTFETPVRIQAEGKPIDYIYAFPATIDLDKDGLNDLVVGEYVKGGELYFYKNIGTKEAPKYGKPKNLMIGDEILTVPGVGNWCTSANPQFVDLDRDGVLDLFSGGFSADPKQGHAPVQFFKGIKDKPFNFEKPVPIKTLSGALPDLTGLQNLINPKTKRQFFPRQTPVRTKPNFVDINADGNLDLIYGEAYGYFIQFKGTASKGINHFSDKVEILKDEDGKLLKVPFSASPHFVDWDGDNDLDIISGNIQGGIFYSENIGDTKTPKWKAFTEWMPQLTGTDKKEDRHIIQNTNKALAPSSETTVFVADYNNDGKLDLLVGDKTLLNHPVKGISDEEYAIKEAKLREMQDVRGPDKIAMTDYYKLLGKNRPDADGNTAPEVQKMLTAALNHAHQLEKDKIKDHTVFRDSFKSSEYAGFVWLYLQK